MGKYPSRRSEGLTCHLVVSRKEDEMDYIAIINFLTEVSYVLCPIFDFVIVSLVVWSVVSLAYEWLVNFIWRFKNGR